MDTESSSDAKEIITKPAETAESPEENKPYFGLVEIINKGKVVKKVDVQFQLDQFKKFIHFGSETYYKSAPRRSINRWFITETNFRLYVEESKIKSIKNLSDVLEKDENEVQKEAIISRMSDILIENKPYSPVGVIPYLLSRMYTLPNLRPVILKTFLTVVKNTADLLIFAYYLRKGSGNQTCIRKQLCEWYKVHSSNREYIKDLLLVKRRLGWKHRDVLVHWKIPVDVNDGILRILMGFPFDKTKIPEDKVSLIEKLLKLRNIDDRAYWIGLVTSQEYIDEVGLDLCYNLKTLIVNAEVLKIVIKRIPFNDLIEYIPRMYQKLPYSQDLITAIVNQLSDWKTKYTVEKSDVNILSVFAVWKWLAFQHYIYHGPGKHLREDSIDKKYYPLPTLDLEKAILSVLEDELFKRSDEVLFVLNASQSDLEESGISISRKPSHQELKRPSLFPNIIKAAEFIQFLLFIYPNHRVVYNEKLYKISGKSFKRLEEEFSKMRQNISQDQSTEEQKTFRNAIYITFDGLVDLGENSSLNEYKAENIALLSIREKEVIQTKEKNRLRNMLVIKGLDCNFLPFIEKYFHDRNMTYFYKTVMGREIQNYFIKIIADNLAEFLVLGHNYY